MLYNPPPPPKKKKKKNDNYQGFLLDVFLTHPKRKLLQTVFKIGNERFIFSECSVSQIDFELVSISKNRSSNL